MITRSPEEARQLRIVLPRIQHVAARSASGLAAVLRTATDQLHVLVLPSISPRINDLRRQGCTVIGEFGADTTLAAFTEAYKQHMAAEKATT